MLLVGRKRNKLVLIKGRVFVEDDVPSFLKEVRVAFDDYEKMLPQSGYLLDELGSRKMTKYLHAGSYGNVYGLWSGKRSALVRDPETEKWYRLKGIALNPKDPLLEYQWGRMRIEGGAGEV